MKDTTQKYIEKYNITPIIDLYSKDSTIYDAIVVIPSHDEDLNMLIDTLESLKKQETNYNYSVCILINYSSNDSDKVRHNSLILYDELKIRYADIHWINTTIIEFSHSKKNGVGMARKYLMDQALLYYKNLNYEENGIIINLDADTKVAPNYINTIVNEYRNNSLVAASVYFEHPIDYQIPTTKAICLYELHLRYFINMQRLIRLPFAYQTIGSAMVVTAKAYAQQGGMPIKQAGEDFYFLHKYTKNNQLTDILKTTVYPSGRISHRVPFGTGKAVSKYVETQELTTYHPKTFKVIDTALSLLWKFVIQNYKSVNTSQLTNINLYEMLPIELNTYFSKNDLTKSMFHIMNQSSNESALFRHFYQWFDAFTLMKTIHHLRDNYIDQYADMDIDSAVDYLFQKLNLEYKGDNYKDLNTLRHYDRTNMYLVESRPNF